MKINTQCTSLPYSRKYGPQKVLQNTVISLISYYGCHLVLSIFASKSDKGNFDVFIMCGLNFSFNSLYILATTVCAYRSCCSIYIIRYISVVCYRALCNKNASDLSQQLVATYVVLITVPASCISLCLMPFQLPLAVLLI